MCVNVSACVNDQYVSMCECVSMSLCVSVCQYVSMCECVSVSMYISMCECVSMCQCVRGYGLSSLVELGPASSGTSAVWPLSGHGGGG